MNLIAIPNITNPRWQCKSQFFFYRVNEKASAWKEGLDMGEVYGFTLLHRVNE
jgi:hypothetical protein